MRIDILRSYLKLVNLIPFLILTLAIESKSLVAPFLISVTEKDSHTSVLNFRNNDFAATKIIVLRKKSIGEWKLVDSVLATVNTYTDSILSSGTSYSYALYAIGLESRSDTSNSLSIVTSLDSLLTPKMEITWMEGRKYFPIRYYDISNAEKGFRFFRKEQSKPWIVIDSVITSMTDTLGWKVYIDSMIGENKWYTYKVQAFNDLQVEYSPESTVFSYTPPKRNKAVYLTKGGSIPAHPMSWIERVGDSLYFPEMVASDTLMAIVDVSDFTIPKFKSYFNLQNIPSRLKKTVVDARVSLPSTNGIFVHSNGFFLVSYGQQVYLYDSASFSVRDSISLPDGLKMNGWLNDTCALIGPSPVLFGSWGIDTLPASKVSWKNSMGGGGFFLQYIFGCYNNMAIYGSVQGVYSMVNSKYYVQNFSKDYLTPPLFSEHVEEEIFRGYHGFGRPNIADFSSVFDTSIVITAIPNDGYRGVIMFAFDIADGHSGPFKIHMGKIIDTMIHGGVVTNIKVDSEKKRIYLVGDDGIFIYSYNVVTVGIRDQKGYQNKLNERIQLSQKLNGIYFDANKIQLRSLQILNVKGEVVKSIPQIASSTVFWNKTDNFSRAVPAGVYFYKIRTAQDWLMSGSMMLSR